MPQTPSPNGPSQDPAQNPAQGTTQPGPQGTPKRKRKLPIVKLLLAVVLAGVLLVVFGIPLIASSGWARGKITASASEQLNTEVRLADLDFGWFSGVSLRGLEVDNPEGFPQDHKLLALGEARMGLSGVGNLIWGGGDGVSLEGAANDLKLVVDENDDGATNLDKILGRDRTKDTPAPAEQEAPTPDGDTGGSGGSDNPAEAFAAWALDLQLNRAEVEVRRQGALVDAMRDIHVQVEKAAGSTTFLAEFVAEIEHGTAPDPGSLVSNNTPRLPGRLQLNAAFEAVAGDVDATGEVRDFDIGCYTPLLRAMFKPGDLEQLAGVVNGTIKVAGNAKQKITTTADITVQEPRVYGGLVQWMDVKAPEWRVKSALDLGQKDGKPSLSAVTADVQLGFATVQVMDEAARNQRFPDQAGMGIAFTADLSQVLQMGGPIPEDLRGSKGQVQGQLLVPVDPNGMPDPTDLVPKLLAAVDIGLEQIDVSGFSVEGLDFKVDLKDGGLNLNTPADGKLNGGPLSIALTADLKDMANTPAKLSLNWQGGQLNGPTGQVLRYGVPLLAGLQESAAIQGLASINGTLDIPLQMRDGEQLLDWLNRLTGQGSLGLTDLSFVPAGSLAPLAEALGDKGQLRVRDFSTSYSIRDGSLDHKLMKLSSKGQEIGLKGKTGLDGSMDYLVDLKPLLAGRGDGEKILRFLGDADIGAGITGSVDSPELAMPDLQGIVQNALKGQLGSVLEGGLGSILGGSSGGEQAGAGDGTKDPNAPKQPAQEIKDKAKKEVNRLLRRIGGGGG